MGSKKKTMGSTMDEIFSLGKKPLGIKSAVIRPQAINAPMLGIIMLERNVPSFCTRTRIEVRSTLISVIETPNLLYV